MAKILIVYSSRTGNTKKLAESIGAGAKGVSGTDVMIKAASEVKTEELVGYDGYVFGSPVYFGSMAADLKRLFDDSVRVRGQLADKVGAAFATGGHPTGGKETTMLSIIHAMLIHQMIVVGDPISSGGHYGIGLVGKDVESEQGAARSMGKHVAEIVKRLS